MTAGCGCGFETARDGLLLMITLITTGDTTAGDTILITAIRPSTCIRLSTATGAITITGTVFTIRMVPGLS